MNSDMANKKNTNKLVEKVINEYIKKICDNDLLNKTFDDKLKNITILTDNLIDYCIKKKIFYFIENKISYTSIVINFKSHLTNFIRNLVDPNNEIINKYIINVEDDNMSMGKMGWDNVSDLNSIMFKNFKNLNETFEKNVSFETQIEITNYDDGFDGFKLNNNYNLYTNNNNNINNDNINNNNDSNDNDCNLIIDNKNVNNKILPIYIKLLINQNKYFVEFTDKLIYMCNILSEQDIKYKKINPYN
jgi:hypothetical protein